MTTAAFPAGFNLERESTFDNDHGVVVDIMSDGTPRQRQLGTAQWKTIKCKFDYLTATQKDTLVSFMETNAANTITWTIDGTNYIGVFKASYSLSMSGPLYNLSFDYYAKVNY